MISISRKITSGHIQFWLSLISAILILTSCSSTPSKKADAPKQVEGYVVQSVQYMYAGKLDAALNSIKLALEVNPNSADAYTVAGLIYSKNNQPELAERYFKRALSIEPNNSAAQNNYGSFLCKHDKPLEAEKVFLAAAKNDNNSQPDVAYTNAGLCVLGVPDSVKASKYFRKALQINPKSPVPLYQLAKIQYSNYQYEHALQFLHHYEKIARPTPKSLLLGAQISEAIGNSQMANKYKILLAQQFPNSAEAKQIISASSSNLGEQPNVYDVRKFIEEDEDY